MSFCINSFRSQQPVILLMDAIFSYLVMLEKKYSSKQLIFFLSSFYLNKWGILLIDSLCFQLNLNQRICSVKPGRYKFTTALLPVCFCFESAGDRGTRTATQTSFLRNRYCAILLFLEYPIA